MDRIGYNELKLFKCKLTMTKSVGLKCLDNDFSIKNFFKSYPKLFWHMFLLEWF